MWAGDVPARIEFVFIRHALIAQSDMQMYSLTRIAFTFFQTHLIQHMIIGVTQSKGANIAGISAWDLQKPQDVKIFT